MGILLKFLINNIKEKKLRTLLIIISIALSGALFLGTNGMSSTLEGVMEDWSAQWVGNADFYIEPGRNTPSMVVYPQKAEALGDKIAYAVNGVLWGSAKYAVNATQTVEISLKGFEYEDLQMINPVTPLDEDGLFPFQGKKIIIPRHMALKYNLSSGDSLALKIFDNSFYFKIAAIVESTGFLADQGWQDTVIMPFMTLSSIYGMRGKSQILLVKVQDGYDKQEVFDEIGAAYKGYNIRWVMTDEEKKSVAENVTVPFRIMLILVLAISVFIIFTCFGVITTERMPVIGTFRSIGATKKMTDMALFGESVLYGVIGGLLSCILGVGAIHLLTGIVVSQMNFGASDMTIIFTFDQLLTAFLLSLFLSVISSLLPIIKVSSIPVKDIILGFHKEVVKSGRLRLIAGMACIILAVGGAFFVPIDLAVVLIPAAMVVTMAGVVLLVPFITRLFTALFEKIFHLIFGNIGLLAAKNLRDNKSILNNISLLVIGISGIFLISNLTYSVTTNISNTYRNAKYQVVMNMYWGGFDKSDLFRLSTVKGIQGYYPLYTTGARMPESNSYINAIHSVRPGLFEHFWDFPYSGDPEKLLFQLTQGRNILVSYKLKRNRNLQEGDILKLELGKRVHEYRVIGFFDSNLNDGSHALIGEKFMKLDGRLKNYKQIWVKTSGSPGMVAGLLADKFKRRYPEVTTLESVIERQKSNFTQITSILQGFSFLAMLIGCIGIINNLIISFIQRKRTLALFRSVGMSKKQIVGMVFVEALSGGLIGSVVGLMEGVLMMIIVPALLKAFYVPSEIYYSTPVLVGLIGAGVFITLLASISPAMRSSKLNLIEALKYE